MPHSQEVLRAFYLIALKKDLNTTDCLAGVGRLELVAGDATLSSPEESLPPLPRTCRRCEPTDAPNDDVALNIKQDSVGLEIENGALHPKAFPNSRVVWNDTACQQCRFQGYHCDLQRPSCWQCQKYSLLCYYEHEKAQDDSQNEPHADPEAEPISWQDSVRDNPYQNLEGNEKLHRIDRRYLNARRGRLSKPIPPEKRLFYGTEGELKDDKEQLLGSPSPSFAELDMESRTASPTRSESDVASRTASPTRSEPNTESRDAPPTDWLGSERSRSFSCRSSSYGSGYTTSLASTESNPTEFSLRHSLTIRTTPPTTGASSTWLPPMAPSDGPPKPFQCTFCLDQCGDQDEWEVHELLEHSPRRIWVCMPSGPVENTNGHDVCVFCGVSDPDSTHFSQHETQHCYGKKRKDRTFTTKYALRQHIATVHNQKEMSHRMRRWSRSPKDNDWYWNCGFCDSVLPSWTDRVVHIGAHFNEGKVMSSWDPLKPSSPLDRKTLNCVAWFPPLRWDARTLWDLELKRGAFSWSQDVLDEQFRCQQCDIDVYFRSKADVERHEYLWHERREVWSCPTIKDIEAGILAPYFFPTDLHTSRFDDRACPYCKKPFVKLAESYPRLNTWDARLRHLEFAHKFDGCEPVCKSTDSAALMLHLANIHYVTWNDKTGEVLESCRKEERPLARKVNIPAVM